MFHLARNGQPQGKAITPLLVAFLLLVASAIVEADELTNSIGTTLRLIEAGRYERGERDAGPGFSKDHSRFNPEGDESPVHPVVLTRPFYLATTEVTIAQFRRFVEETSYKSSAEMNPGGAVGWDPQPPADRPNYVATFRGGAEFNWKDPGFAQTDDHPVVCVSFVDAQAYCDWLSKREGTTYRLPTEAEWEFAARAGTQTFFSFGDVYRGTIHRFANIGNVELEKAFPDRVRRQWLVDVEREPADKHIFTAPAGSYEANPWGLSDLYGNVWEWCADRYLDTAYAPYVQSGYQQVRKRAIDPLNESPGGNAGDWRVIRGGSWFNSPVQCRSSVRGYFEATDAACYIGFRIVRQASDEQIAAAAMRFSESETARETMHRLADRVQERRDGRLTIELNQQRTRLTDEFLSALQAMDEPVDLYVDGRGSLTGTQIASLLETPQLRGLSISNIGSNIVDADFAGLSKHPQLELLQLSGAPQISNAIFEHLPMLGQLEQLQLDSAQITDDGLLSLAELKQLKTLQLDGTASHGLALQRFRGAPLERFSCDKLSDAGAQLLGEFDTVREVWVANSPLTGRGLAAIARLPRLHQLDLSRCKLLNDADFSVLDDTYELGYVRLPQTAAGDQTVTALLRLNNLQELHIGSENLTDAGLRQLCGIVSLRNLLITAETTRVTDAGFADLWRLINLHSLGIAVPNVSGSGLSTLHELPALQRLTLDGASISDVACEHLAKSESLQQLSIGSWQEGGPPALSDVGLRHLAGAQGLQRLELIRRRTAVTDEGLAELRRRQPQLNVNAHSP